MKEEKKGIGSREIIPAVGTLESGTWESCVIEVDMFMMKCCWN